MREIFVSISKVRIVERCEDLQVEILWTMCYWKKDQSEVWHLDSPDQRDSWLCSQWTFRDLSKLHHLSLLYVIYWWLF